MDYGPPFPSVLLLSRDFVGGAVTTLALVILYRVYQFWYGRTTLARIQATAHAPVKHKGDDNTITIWGDSPPNDPEVVRGVSDFSPFVLRVEAYLRLIHQPYVKRATITMAENPRHKIPYANVFGDMVDDSARILQTIQRKLNVEQEPKLTAHQKAMGHLISTLLCEGLYFTMLHALVDTKHGQDHIWALLQEKVSIPPLRLIIFQSVIENEHKNTWGQGYGRYPEAYVIEKAMQDLEALSIILGDNEFILGTPQATLYDIDVYAFVGICFLSSFAAPLDWIQQAKRQFPNLVQHTHRLKDLLYPEHAKDVESEYVAEDAS
mmetsp:Transcript_24658/g.46910  ORF Transcript_24658/g.46910 Transcript_24658/m.46910 type:complete len:321 (+) Transcript_24658:70-1032(+)|eukprot:scaffold243_cov175-Amphora_coffeaeformis.AAC.3